jgi:acyl-coenzyme A thioesterase PaaI-like protein
MQSVPFSRAVAVTPARPGGAGRFRVDLLRDWEADGAKQHGGVLLALATSAALATLDERDGCGAESIPGWQPLAVSVVFVRAGSSGEAEAATEVLGARASDGGVPGTETDVAVVRSTLRQDGEVLLDTTVTAGRLPPEPEPPEVSASRLSPAPPPELLERTGSRPTGPPLASACEVVIDPSTTAYRRKERAEPAMRGWVRPRGEEPDVLFALFAGDILPSGLFNFGLVGWAPTVQLTALLRAAPAPGWLRVETETRTISGGWFDEDVTVFDAGGRLICQARQLARSPRPRT